jgi:transcriptional regulator with XRE-family HTH domain
MSESPGLVPEWDMADRMRKALRHGGITVQDMAEYLGVSRKSVGNWIGGRIEPGTQTLRLWALRTGVSYEWLAGDARRSPRARRAAPAAVRRLDG